VEHWTLPAKTSPTTPCRQRRRRSSSPLSDTSVCTRASVPCFNGDYSSFVVVGDADTKFDVDPGLEPRVGSGDLQAEHRGTDLLRRHLLAKSGGTYASPESATGVDNETCPLGLLSRSVKPSLGTSNRDKHGGRVVQPTLLPLLPPLWRRRCPRRSAGGWRIVRACSAVGRDAAGDE
jgi:hypothetical protein